VTVIAERGGAAQTNRSVRPFALVAVADARMRADVTAQLRSLGAVDVAEASSVAEARALAGRNPCGFAVLDLALPDGSGLRLLADLRSAGLSRAVVLSSTHDPHAVRTALASGVKGYLATGSRTRRSEVPAPVTSLRARPEHLSAREVQVLTLVAAGRSNRQIGEALGLSALTVKSHLARIGRKLGSGDRAEMVAVAMRAGTVS